MRRRDLIGLLGGAAAASRPLSVFAQTPSKRPLIAAQIGGSKTETDRDWGGFSQGMRELGYVESHDFGFEVRYADDNVSRIPTAGGGAGPSEPRHHHGRVPRLA